jgi:hypothetical protein
MTQAEFNKLPGLLLRKQFQQVTGLNDKDLDAMTVTCNQLSDAEIERVRRVGLLPVLRPQGPNGHGKYYKLDAARLAQFQM